MEANEIKAPGPVDKSIDISIFNDMNKPKSRTQEQADLLNKVRRHYLREREKEGGQTQKEIAEEIGIDHVYLNRYFMALENGERLRKMNKNNLKQLRAFVERARL